MSGIALGLYAWVIEWPGYFEFLVIWFALNAIVAFFAKIDEKLNE